MHKQYRVMQRNGDVFIIQGPDNCHLVITDWQDRLTLAEAQHMVEILNRFDA